MRHSKIDAGGGSLVRRSPLWRRLLPVILFAVVAIWALYSFGQELYLEHQLSAQAARLAAQNQALAAQNDGYQRDTMALSSGAGAEEDARLNGYARSDERVYVVGSPPSPTPGPNRAAAGASPIHTGASNGSVWSWLSALFHR